MATKPAAPTAKTTQVSVSAIIMPPRAGRNIRDPCQSMELRATALIMCSRVMRLGKNACRPGKSKPTMSAIAPAMASTCQTVTTPLPSRRASRARRPAMIVEVAMSIRRRSTRSATTPPTRAAAMVGMEEAAPEESEVQRGPAQLVDQPSLAHDQQLERPHRGERSQQVAPVGREPQRPRNAPPESAAHRFIGASSGVHRSLRHAGRRGDGKVRTSTGAFPVMPESGSGPV